MEAFIAPLEQLLTADLPASLLLQPAPPVDAVQLAQTEIADDPLPSIDLAQVLGRSAEGRLQWLQQALPLVASGGLNSGAVYDIIAHRRFSVGLTDHIRRQMRDIVRGAIDHFSAKQHRWFLSDANKLNALGEGGEAAEGHEASGVQVATGSAPDASSSNLGPSIGWDVNVAAAAAASAVKKATERKERAAAAAADTDGDAGKWARAAMEWVKTRQADEPAAGHASDEMNSSSTAGFGAAPNDRDELRLLLEELGLEKYMIIFHGRGLATIDRLREVTKADLRELGMLPGHVKLLQQTIAARPQAPPPTIEQPPPPPAEAAAAVPPQPPVAPVPTKPPAGGGATAATAAPKAEAAAAVAEAASAVAAAAAAAAVISKGAAAMQKDAKQAAKMALQRQKAEAAEKAAEEAKKAPPIEWKAQMDLQGSTEEPQALQRPPLLTDPSLTGGATSGPSSGTISFTIGSSRKGGAKVQTMSPERARLKQAAAARSDPGQSMLGQDSKEGSRSPSSRRHRSRSRDRAREKGRERERVKRRGKTESRSRSSSSEPNVQPTAPQKSSTISELKQLPPLGKKSGGGGGLPYFPGANAIAPVATGSRTGGSTGVAATTAVGGNSSTASVSSTRSGGWDALSAPADEVAARERFRQLQHNNVDMEQKIASQLLSAATMRARNGGTAFGPTHAAGPQGTGTAAEVEYDSLRAAQIKAASRLCAVPAQSYVPFRSGDWLCPLCNAHNYKSKQRCYRCIVGVKPIV